MVKEYPYITILTPTYNRAQLLCRCYESLKKQTELSFQWLIIDDGSTDCTQERVKRFIQESPKMNITYVRKKNGGKHTAINYSHPYIQGNYVLILDSDDILTEDAVETVYREWSMYEKQQEIGIVILLKGQSVNSPNAYAKDERVPVDIMAYKRVCISGRDCCEVIRTNLIKMYPFPEFENEKFISEGALWNRVSFTHKCVYINKVIYLCEYLEGGLTRAGRKLRIQNPLGGMYTSNLRMNEKNEFKERIKSGLLYMCYGYFAELDMKKMIMQDNTNRVLKLLCVVPGWIMYVIWKKRYTVDKR